MHGHGLRERHQWGPVEFGGNAELIGSCDVPCGRLQFYEQLQLPGMYVVHHCWHVCPGANWHCTPELAPITEAHCEELPHDQCAHVPLPPLPPQRMYPMQAVPSEGP